MKVNKIPHNPGIRRAKGKVSPETGNTLEEGTGVRYLINVYTMRQGHSQNLEARVVKIEEHSSPNPVFLKQYKGNFFSRLS